MGIPLYKMFMTHAQKKDEYPSQDEVKAMYKHFDTIRQSKRNTAYHNDIPSLEAIYSQQNKENMQDFKTPKSYQKPIKNDLPFLKENYYRSDFQDMVNALPTKEIEYYKDVLQGTIEKRKLRILEKLRNHY